jgi:lipopolysaccharide biosynthesis glycosyltransferase
MSNLTIPSPFKKKLNIVFSFNDQYLVPAINLIRSLKLNGGIEFVLYLFTIEDNLSTKSREFLDEYLKQIEIDLVYISITEEIKDFALLEGDFLPAESFARLVIPLTRIFDELGTVWWFDVDMLVRKNLIELQNLPTGYSLAAVPEASNQELWETKHFPELREKNWYFNAGLLRFDLSEMRRTRIPDEIYKIVSNYDKYDFKLMDQDVLNFIFSNNYLRLDSKFNGGGAALVIPDQVAIAHFYGQLKPWQWKRKPNVLTLGRSFIEVFREYQQFNLETLSEIRQNLSKEQSDFYVSMSKKVVIPTYKLFLRRVRHLLNIRIRLKKVKNYFCHKLSPKKI